jgi:hypothetical protein
MTDCSGIGTPVRDKVLGKQRYYNDVYTRERFDGRTDHQMCEVYVAHVCQNCTHSWYRKLRRSKSPCFTFFKIVVIALNTFCLVTKIVVSSFLT